MNPQQPPPTARTEMRSCSFRELDQPDSAYNRAAAATRQGDPFCCRTEWQFSYHEVRHPRLPLHLWQGGDSVIAFAEHPHFAPGPQLQPLESGWLFGQPLLGQHAVALLDALLCELAARRAYPDVLITGLLPRSPLLRRLNDTFRSRYHILRLPPATLSSASLDGGLDGFLSRRSGSLRRNLKQVTRRTQERGVTYERHVPRSAEEAATLYARMLAVERTSWKGIGRCGMAEPFSREFYAAMLRRLSVSGAGRVMFARCGDRDIGFIFGGMAGAVYRGQQFSYAEDWSPFSIGNLLQVEQIRWLAEENAVRYDMGPRMDYKLHWTELSTRIGARVLQPKARWN